MRSRLGSGLANAADRLRGTSSTEIDRLRLAIGNNSATHVRGRTFPDIREAEFSVYSQWGEDGIIQWLVSHAAADIDTFVEIGVQDYTECNTRFLMCNDNWSGVIIDSGTAHAQTLERDGLRWRYTIEAVSAWVTRDNVGGLIADAGFAGDIGLLSVDIDGNDYHVLEHALTDISPRIIVVEYNSAFGPDRALTIPYRKDFDRTRAHPSYLYFGASLAAFDRLLRAKGYSLCGSNKAGNNAFFVRGDVAGDLPTPTVAAAYARSRYRESRGPDGQLTYLDPHAEGLELIADLPVIDVDTGAELTIGDALLS